MAVELRNSIEEAYGVFLPMRELLAGPSLLVLQASLQEKLAQGKGVSASADLPHLSDAEVDQLLSQLVAGAD